MGAKGVVLSYVALRCVESAENKLLDKLNLFDIMRPQVGKTLRQRDPTFIISCFSLSSVLSVLSVLLVLSVCFISTRIDCLSYRASISLSLVQSFSFCLTSLLFVVSLSFSMLFTLVLM